ncbi:MAG: secretin and TonB N-terminal domain-containing protein [Candidatus Omnitrophica bacterium]|nr:secretin and TonB N-terminal domain-containing protein [Candidatus Omnitrophota bacterium]
MIRRACILTMIFSLPLLPFMPVRSDAAENDTVEEKATVIFKSGLKKVEDDGSVSTLPSGQSVADASSSARSAEQAVVSGDAGIREEPRDPAPPSAQAADSPEGKISLNLRNIDINEALKFFSLKSGFNIVPTRNVAGRVTLTVENAPIEDVLDIMLRSNNLAYDVTNGIYNVMTEAEYRQRYGRNFSDTREVKVFRLKYAVPSQAFSLLEAIKSDIGRLLVDQESGSVLIIDTPEKIAQMQKAVDTLEQQSEVKVYNLQYAQARDVEQQLKAQLELKKVGTIRADERTNQVIVQTLPERMENIDRLIESLDRKTKGVLVDIKIIKIRLTDQLDTGIEWEGLFNIAKDYGMTYIGSYPFSSMTAGITNPTFTTRSDVYSAGGHQVGYYPFSGTTSSLSSSAKVAPGEKMHIGIIDQKRDFDVVVNYLQTLGKSKIIASPSLSVINNQEAKIHIGERRAFITTTTTTGSTTTTVSEEVTYVDVGVRLALSPTINDEGYVILKIKPEISSVVGTVTSSSNNVIPIIDTNTAETTVIAKDGATVILGGLGREEVTESSEGVPFLSDIPLLGLLFQKGSTKTEHVELVIMLTPIIFEGDVFISAHEQGKFSIKPLKEPVDVFKPEVPREAAPAVYIPLKAKDVLPKGFRTYN